MYKLYVFIALFTHSNIKRYVMDGFHKINVNESEIFFFSKLNTCGKMKYKEKINVIGQ